MEEKSVIAQIVRDHPGVEPEELAVQVREQLTEEDILELITNEIARAQRTNVRHIEHDVLDALYAKGGAMSPIIITGGDPLRLLFGQKLSIGEGVSILAEEMTLDQWVQRRVLLENQRAGLEKAIEICRLAEERIKQAGVTKLSEVMVTV